MAAPSAVNLCNLLMGTVCMTYSSVFPLASSAPSIPSTTATQCQAYFSGVPPGNFGDTSGDTIGCRLNYATMAQNQTNTPPYYCHFAGPSGGGVCGNAVQSTCNRIVSICNGIASLPASYVNNASACVADQTTNNIYLQTGSLAGGAASGENSLECRLYHAIAGYQQNSAGTTTTPHCGHVVGTGGPCTGAVSNNVNHYCGMMEVGCTADHQQYFSNGQTVPAAASTNHFFSCTGSVAAFPPCSAVVVGDTNQTQCARQYHANANLGLGNGSATPPWNTAHCAHAGPSGGGVVGDTRTSWMFVTNGTGCGQTPANKMVWVAAQIGQAMQAWPATLLKVVPSDAAPLNYNVPALSAGNADTETCRTYHASTGNVGGGLAVHCAHGSILGGGQCPMDMTGPLCRLIMNACPSAYASSTACATAFAPYVPAATNPKTGDPCAALAGHPDASDSLACRVFFATAALTTGGMGNTMAVNCMNAAVLGATGCNVSALPPAKASASIVSVSGVLALLAALW